MNEDTLRVRELESQYTSICDSEDYNSREAIEAFHNWYKALLLLLKDYFSPTNEDFFHVKNAEVTGNGYTLHTVYRDIAPRSELMLDDIEKGIVTLRKVSKTKQNMEEKTPMVFISHSSNDVEFANALVVMLENIGFDPSNLFCSSVDGYGVGLSKDIFETLLSLFKEHELFMIFIHSPHYYLSPVSLNEMGAAWVLKTDFCSFLTTNMDFGGMKGVVNNSTISIKVDKPDAPARLTELKDKLISLFGLKNVDGIKWERVRKAFLDTVTNIYYPEKKQEQDSKKKVEFDAEEIEVLKQWVASDNPYSLQMNLVGNRMVYNLGYKSYEVIKAEDKAAWEDFFERLMELGFISLAGYDKSNQPQYKLKKAAYDYVNSL